MTADPRQMFQQVYRAANRPPVFIGAFLVILTLMAAVAVVFGYDSVDSWYYMMLAHGLRHGQLCGLDGQYAAIYPCGYPAALALTAPSSSLTWLMVSSKITNLILLAASGYFIWKASNNPLVAAAAILNPIVIHIGLYTWSENLLFFCTSGAFFAISRLEYSGATKDRILLGVFLVIGCFARYVFGPFAFILFCCAWLAYGRPTAIRALPSFCVAGVVFLAYQGINHWLTGFGTGMPRVPAPETFFLLVSSFIQAMAGMIVMIAIGLILLIGAAWTEVRVSTWPRRNAPALFLLAAGLGFLALGFVLRARTLFDPFGVRTLGYGVALAAAGLVGLFVDLRRPQVYPVLGVIACGLFSLIFADGNALPSMTRDMLNGHYLFPPSAFDKLKFHGPPADVMVYFVLPDPDGDMGVVDTVEDIYYGPSTNLLSPRAGPDNTPQTAQSFLHDLQGEENKRCFFDFTPFPTADDFKDYLDSSTLTDQSFSLIPGKTNSTFKPNLDPSVRAWLAAVAQPGKLVPCRDILANPATRAAEAG